MNPTLRTSIRGAMLAGYHPWPRYCEKERSVRFIDVNFTTYLFTGGWAEKGNPKMKTSDARTSVLRQIYKRSNKYATLAKCQLTRTMLALRETF